MDFLERTCSDWSRPAACPPLSSYIQAARDMQVRVPILMIVIEHILCCREHILWLHVTCKCVYQSLYRTHTAHIQEAVDSALGEGPRIWHAYKAYI